jgi:hypothetical protein
MGWCHDCNELVAIEHFAPLADYQDLLADRERNGPNEEDQDGAKLCKEDLNDYFRHRNELLRAMIEWRRRRKSPPRCLTCASTNIEELISIGESDSRGFEHPGCGGILRFQRGYVFIEERLQLLTSEGLPFTNTS